MLCFYQREKESYLLANFAQWSFNLLPNLYSDVVLYIRKWAICNFATFTDTVKCPGCPCEPLLLKCVGESGHTRVQLDINQTLQRRFSFDIMHIHPPPPPVRHVLMIYGRSNIGDLVAARSSNLCLRVRCRSCVSGRPWWQLLWVPAQGLADVGQDGRGGQEDVLRSPAGNTGGRTCLTSGEVVSSARAAPTLARTMQPVSQLALMHWFCHRNALQQ